MPRGLGLPILDEARAVLGEADDALAGFTCDRSTDCCRFGVTGREPWLTEVEWRLVVDEVKRTGRRLAAFARALDDSERAGGDGEERCPFLDDGGRCLVYAARPLGCRTFFCERARGPGPIPTTTLRALPRRLAALSTSSEGARPLRSWLRGALTQRRG